jgi:hypothetical protein
MRRVNDLPGQSFMTSGVIDPLPCPSLGGPNLTLETRHCEPRDLDRFKLIQLEL